MKAEAKITRSKMVKEKKLDEILYVEVLSINSNNIIISIIIRIGKYKYYNK